MKLFDINIIEHPDFSGDEAWVVFNKDAPQVPQDLRDTLATPCILTGDKAQAKHMLTLLQAVAALQTPQAPARKNALINLLT